MLNSEISMRAVYSIFVIYEFRKTVKYTQLQDRLHTIGSSNYIARNIL